MLSYWKQFHANSHLAGLGLIDMTAFPMSDGDWNSHSLRGHNADGFNAFAAALLGNPKGFVDGFTAKMFKDQKFPAGEEWIKEEALKLPPYIGMALYSDYVYSDFTDVLKTVTVPTLVLSANSGIFPNSIKQGQWMTSQIPQGKFVEFTEGGHMLFYLEADKFNKVVAEFARGLK